VKEIGSIDNPEYRVNIARGLPSIADYGNIQTPGDKQDDLLVKLAQKVSLCVQRGNLVFQIGGTRDSLVALVKGTKTYSCLYVLVRQCLDLDEVKDKVTQSNSLRAAFTGISEGSQVAILGLQQTPSEEELKILRQICPGLKEIMTAEEGSILEKVETLIN
jgi:arginase family enzyme